MSKKIKILTPRIYEHSDFFHNAVDFARKHSLNTNELCLELSHYLVDNFDKVWKIEKPRVYKRVADLQAKLAESESRFQVHKQTDVRTIQDQTDLIEQLKQQLAEKDKEIKQLNNRILFSQLQAPKEQILNILGSQCIQYNPDQDKISFAVEQLEKVKENLLNFPAVTNEDIKILKKKQKEHFDKRLMDFCKHNLNFIDNQIKQLKEGK